MTFSNLQTMPTPGARESVSIDDVPTKLMDAKSIQPFGSGNDVFFSQQGFLRHKRGKLLVCLRTLEKPTSSSVEKCYAVPLLMGGCLS